MAYCHNESLLAEMMLSDVIRADGGAISKPSSKDFLFALKVRVECPSTLWRAAASHCMRSMAVRAEDLADLIGPPEDPSIEDCLMALALPAQIPGCSLLDVDLELEDAG